MKNMITLSLSPPKIQFPGVISLDKNKPPTKEPMMQFIEISFPGHRAGWKMVDTDLGEQMRTTAQAALDDKEPKF